jgi:hypothetical protein
LRIEEICDWKYCDGDKVEEDWMGWACGGEKRCLHGVVGNLKEMYLLQDQGVDERIILE